MPPFFFTYEHGGAMRAPTRIAPRRRRAGPANVMHEKCKKSLLSTDSK